MGHDALHAWLLEHGGGFHVDTLSSSSATTGRAIIAANDIPQESVIVSCPFHLAVTPALASRALEATFPGCCSSQWSEKQLICTYLALHHILPENNHDLLHHAYVATLPQTQDLCTPLHFTQAELESLKGTNLYHATLDRERDWRSDWASCKKDISAVDDKIGQAFTWELYLTAATYLSSRAFPSSVLSRTPSLQAGLDTHPVLLPGVDALNHRRAQPVSWVVNPVVHSSTSVNGSDEEDRLAISIVIHESVAAGSEVFNNYGAKPNAEFILGYGFSLANNPDDTMVLKIGGAGPSSPSSPTDPGNRRFEVGRELQGAEELWQELLKLIVASGSSPPLSPTQATAAPSHQHQHHRHSSISSATAETTVEEYEFDFEDELDAASMLQNMLQQYQERMPTACAQDARGVVKEMWTNYLEGQRDIVASLLDFAKEKEEHAINTAREAGIELVFED